MAHRDFNDIYVGMQHSIHRLAAGLMGSVEDAGDVVQDLYEHLWLRRERVSGQPSPEAYIMASARNLCLDRLRSRRRGVEFSTAMRAMTATGERPDEGQMEEIVESLVAALPEGQATVYRLREVECMEMEEIARVMGIRETAVRMSLSRARGTVREKLAKIMNDGI
jgi:RNA polymerase sigma-70 factor (ECF subfamily)